MTPIMTLNMGAVQATLIALQHSTGDVEEAGRAALAAGAQVLLKAARKVLALTDHKPVDLARLDHPYAVRHGRILIHKSTPWKVHTQSGALLRALKDAAYDAQTGPAHMVYLDASQAPHALYVVQGTRNMLPRDPLWTGTALQPPVQRATMQAVIKVLGKELRTKLGVRFEVSR